VNEVRPAYSSILLGVALLACGGGSDPGGQSPGPTGDPTLTPCAGLTLNGRCTGNLYQWCDYFAGGTHSLDCGALGLTCRASATQEEGGEEDTNGCVGGSCTSADNHCDGSLKVECYAAQLVTNDCTKWHGPGGSCALQGSGSVDCEGYPPCSPSSTIGCDGSVLRVCTETGGLYIEDCARSDPAGTCEPVSSSFVRCGGMLTGL
jgi:hypothetical protein